MPKPIKSPITPYKTAFSGATIIAMPPNDGSVIEIIVSTLAGQIESTTTSEGCHVDPTKYNSIATRYPATAKPRAILIGSLVIASLPSVDL
jgi:hypothetical protein